MTERQILWSGNESYLSSGGDSEKHALKIIIHLKENTHCNGVCGTFGTGAWWVNMEVILSSFI